MNIDKNFEEELKKKVEEGYPIIPRQLFLQVPLEFIKNPKYTMQQKMLYMYIWTYGINTKYGYPSQATIMKDLKIKSRVTLIDLYRQLEELGGMYVISRYKKENKKEKLPNLYYLSEIDEEGNFSCEVFNILKKIYPDKKAYV